MFCYLCDIQSNLGFKIDGYVWSEVSADMNDIHSKSHFSCSGMKMFRFILPWGNTYMFWIVGCRRTHRIFSGGYGNHSRCHTNILMRLLSIFMQKKYGYRGKQQKSPHKGIQRHNKDTIFNYNGMKLRCSTWLLIFECIERFDFWGCRTCTFEM